MRKEEEERKKKENKPLPMDIENLNKLIKVENMYGETDHGHFTGPTICVVNEKAIGTLYFDHEGNTFQYSLFDDNILYEGEASFDWKTKKCNTIQAPC